MRRPPPLPVAPRATQARPGPYHRCLAGGGSSTGSRPFSLCCRRPGSVCCRFGWSRAKPQPRSRSAPRSQACPRRGVSLLLFSPPGAAGGSPRGPARPLRGAAAAILCGGSGGRRGAARHRAPGDAAPFVPGERQRAPGGRLGSRLPAGGALKGSGAPLSPPPAAGPGPGPWGSFAGPRGAWARRGRGRERGPGASCGKHGRGVAS